LYCNGLHYAPISILHRFRDIATSYFSKITNYFTHFVQTRALISVRVVPNFIKFDTNRMIDEQVCIEFTTTVSLVE